MTFPAKAAGLAWKYLPCAAFGLVLFACQDAHAYSVLSHEAIIDLSWDSGIEPLLRKRFPSATPEELIEAHAHAYGGSIIQDLGYYPFGSKFYSDLTHYVRSGDFISFMIRESQDLNEYAFALGSLAHFAADNNGHKMATNVSVPLLYPKLRRKFGNTVTYADDPLSHAKTEFGFDVYQAAKTRYAADAYRSFIGFKVSKPVLERAFLDTYGIELKDVFLNVDLAIGTYRKAVGSVLPELTKVAWHLKNQEIVKSDPTMTRQKFLYSLSRAGYEKEWGTSYRRPGFGTRVLAMIIRIMPRIGPFRSMAYRRQTPETEALYKAGFDASLAKYKELLADVNQRRLTLPNDNFDVGDATKAGKYSLTDEAYAKLLHKLDDHYADIPQALRTDILAFYQDLDLPIATKAHKHDWATLLEDLNHLRAVNQQLTAATHP